MSHTSLTHGLPQLPQLSPTCLARSSTDSHPVALLSLSSPQLQPTIFLVANCQFSRHQPPISLTAAVRHGLHSSSHCLFPVRNRPESLPLQSCRTDHRVWRRCRHGCRLLARVHPLWLLFDRRRQEDARRTG